MIPQDPSPQYPYPQQGSEQPQAPYPPQMPEPLPNQGMPQEPSVYVPPPYGSGDGAQPPTIAPAVEVHLTDGFNYAWLKLRQNLGTLILVGLTYLGAAAALSLIFVGMFLASRSAGAAAFAIFVLLVVVFLFSAITQANVMTGILKLVAGDPVEYRDFFAFQYIGNVLLASLLIALSSAFLSFTVVAPVVISFFTLFTVPLIVDKGYGAWDAISGSIKIVWTNVATIIMFGIAAAIATYAGALFFGLGLLLAFPVIVITQVWLYKKLIGEQL